MEIIARGEDTSNQQKNGAAVLAAYGPDNRMMGVDYKIGRITKERGNSLQVSLAGKAGETLEMFLWDSLTGLNPLLK